jgi:hypothetical protein
MMRSEIKRFGKIIRNRDRAKIGQIQRDDVGVER